MASHRARPALRLLRRSWLALLLSAAALLITAGPALAAPDPPRLVGTHPGSPGLSTTPRVFGTVGAVGATVVGPRSLLGPSTDTLGPEGTITIYSDPACGGPEVASGDAEDFESSGILTAVLPGSTTNFYATFTDSTGISTCSAGIAYRQVDDPPVAPSVSGVSPGGPADFNFPSVLGSAEEGSMVEIFTNPSCSGAAFATGGAAQFAAGIQVAVADNTVTTFYARASWAELPSPCSSTSIGYQEVTASAPPSGPGPEQPGGGTAPPVVSDPPGRPSAPKIHSEPHGPANVIAPRIVGSAAGAVRVDFFRNEGCDGARAATATPAELALGVPLQVAANATTVISAIAVDASGERSRCTPDPVVYVEDSVAPLTRITFGPGAKTRKRSPVFRFADISGDPTGTSFLCKLDKRPWQACQTPWHLSRLRPRSHLVQIRAVDTAGNQEVAGTKRRFKVVSASSR